MAFRTWYRRCPAPATPRTQDPRPPGLPSLRSTHLGPHHPPPLALGLQALREHPLLSRPKSPGPYPRCIPGRRVGSMMSYLGLQDLGISIGEETPNPSSGVTSPARPIPWRLRVFQDLRQAVRSSPRPGHQEAGELSLGGVLYPLPDKAGSEVREGRYSPRLQYRSPGPSSRETRGPLPQPLKRKCLGRFTFNIFSSPSMRRRRTGMSIPVPEERRQAGAWSPPLGLRQGP